MLKMNSILIYGSSGICKVADIRKEKFGDEEQEYYILKPIYDEKSTIYVPKNNEQLLKKIRRILSAEEIYAIIKNMPEKETLWITEDRLRNETYKAIIEEGNREEIIKVIKTLYLRKQELVANRKKLRSSDETIMQKAEKMLYDEFAMVLNINQDDVVPFIMEQIHCSEK